MVYKITESFPKTEIYGLYSQIRRCSVSITSNIAEGFNRYSKNDKLRFYYIALGSVAEPQSHVKIAPDVGCITNKEFDVLFNQAIKVHKIVNGLIASGRKNLK